MSEKNCISGALRENAAEGWSRVTVTPLSGSETSLLAVCISVCLVFVLDSHLWNLKGWFVLGDLYPPFPGGFSYQHKLSPSRPHPASQQAGT